MLRLHRAVYPKIFLGKIRKWNDPAIAIANPGIDLPDLDITVIGRTDSSGTTFVFSQHLTRIPDDMIVWLPDPAGDKSYPITTYTWMIFYKKYDDPKKAEALRKMIAYCLDE